MESYSKLSETELLHLINVEKDNHESLKKQMIEITTIIEEKEKEYNEKIEILEGIENKYVELIQELTARK